MNENNNESAASFFDRTAKLSTVIAERLDGKAALAMAGTAALSKVVATLIRAVGIDDANALIAELVANKRAGEITDAALAEDDAEIANAVKEAYQVVEVDTFGTGEIDPDSPLVTE